VAALSAPRWAPALSEDVGVVLVVMAKDESDHLAVNLPLWRKWGIRHFVIGIDDRTTDNSIEVVQETLQGVERWIQKVEFDGFGPAYNTLVTKARQKWPGVRYILMADADWQPVVDSYPYKYLKWHGWRKGGCAQLVFQVADLAVTRDLDWLFLNAPGVEVRGRVHHFVRTPANLSAASGRECHLPLQLRELTKSRTSSNKGNTRNALYLKLLHRDLEDAQLDPTVRDVEKARTLYYLGIHYMSSYEQAENSESTESKWWLQTAQKYFGDRISIATCNPEERWWSMVRLGYIKLFFNNDPKGATALFFQAIEADSERAEPYIYLGHRYMSFGKSRGRALRFLKKAAALPLPTRYLEVDSSLYECRAKATYMRAAADLVYRNEEFDLGHVEGALLAAQQVRAKCEISNANEHEGMEETLHQALVRFLPERFKSIGA